MARRRFFVPEVRRGLAELSGPDAEHLVRVLRVEPGQLFELSDNRNVYLAEITSARKSSVQFCLLEQLPFPAPSVHVTLVAALIKFERFEWLIEKATELGISVIQPMEATRSERGLAQASRKRSARWERVAREASEQSRRAHLPEIAPVLGFDEALEFAARVRLLLDENPEAPPILHTLPEERSPEDRVALLLGPEGGWTAEERQAALAAGWHACSLGGTILRAETAALSAVAIIRAAWHQPSS
ncbi:MAG: 16S rRNA (uracil(1498)-N(3))-methyltransferase [Acidobacteriaceae bacterium]|nr:16S rRNA (uracil(1498)-N(3))-methyltransferase [Acidobacteriaceae bacterium]